VDGGERAARQFRVAVERHLGCVGLDGDHAHPVRDDVVELARDPRSLLRHRGVRRPLALALEVPRELAEPRSACPCSRCTIRPTMTGPMTIETAATNS
jgi:hypothetical protein